MVRHALKILQQSVSDHFTTLRSKGLNQTRVVSENTKKNNTKYKIEKQNTKHNSTSKTKNLLNYRLNYSTRN